MKRPMVSVRDPETLKRVIREMNDEEFAQWKIDGVQFEQEEKDKKAKEKERKQKVKKLVSKLAESVDLTEDEISELLRLTFPSVEVSP